VTGYARACKEIEGNFSLVFVGGQFQKFSDQVRGFRETEDLSVVEDFDDLVCSVLCIDVVNY
jgi:hypothetical protein